MKRIIKILCVALTVLVVSGVGLGVWMFTAYSGAQDNPFAAFSNATTLGVDEPVSKDGATYYSKDQTVHILILGIDSNASRESRNKGYRSDVMILLTVDFKHNRISTVSIPRDTRVDMNKLDPATGEVVSKTTNKINAAYAFGGGPNHFGAQNAMDCTENFLSCNGKFNIPVDLYVSIDMDGIPKLVKTVGGVDVVLDRDLKGIGKKGEKVTITEKSADSYLRNRKTGGGDDGRAARQVEFVVQILQKIQKKGAMNLASRLYSDFLTYGKTNMTLEQVLSLATILESVDVDELERYRVRGTGETINGSWQYIPDMDELEEFILKEFYDKD